MNTAAFIKLSKFFPYLLVLLPIIVFLPTFSNDFQRGWDDNWMVLESPFVQSHHWDYILYNFKDFCDVRYSPVNTLFYILPYELFGFNPVAFHSFFLAIHILNVVLVYYIIQNIIKTANPEFSITRMQRYAFFVALIFAIHPLQVESVAWISASKVVIYTFFMLTAMWCYMQYIQGGRLGWLLAIAILYIFCYGAKEQGVILPLNLVLLDYLYGRKYFDAHTPIKGWRSRLKLLFSAFKKRVLLEKIPFFLMALGFWYFSSLYYVGSFVIPNNYCHPLYQRLFFSMHSIVEYIFRTIAPVKLFFYYFFPMKVGEKLPLFYWSYLVLTIIIGAFVWANHKKKLVFFGFLFFIINILLVLHIMPMPRNFITADRYMYISIIGLALIGAWFIELAFAKYVKYQKPFMVLGLCYILALGVQSFKRTQEWKNSTTMKKNIVELVEKRKAQKQAIPYNPLKQISTKP